MTEPQHQHTPHDHTTPDALSAPARCACGGERPPPRHHVDITVGQHTVIVTSDAPTLAEVAGIARDLHVLTRPAQREAAGFAAGSAPASAITERRGTYDAPPVVPASASGEPFTPTAEQPYDLSWVTKNGG